MSNSSATALDAEVNKKLASASACPTTAFNPASEALALQRFVRQFVQTMPKTFFITTAIYYTNSSPHVGHAYEMVLADVIARYYRLKGEKVFFLTGVDQHGQKVQQSATKAGVPPGEFVKGITQRFVDLWEKLDVKYDEWAETTADRHKDRKSTRLNSSHVAISYAVFCL